MGDRCYMSVRVRADQIKLFCEASGLCEPDAFELDDSTADAELEEVNYGGYDGLVEAAQQGVVFVGNHGAGDEYGPGRFAGVCGRYAECRADYETGNLIVTADDNDTVSATVLRALKKFVAFYKKAEAALCAKNPPKPKRKRVKS